VAVAMSKAEIVPLPVSSLESSRGLGLFKSPHLSVRIGASRAG
jgi:hypothetical protein